MPLEWLCVCDEQSDASGVRRCSSCEPMWIEPGQAPRPVLEGVKRYFTREGKLDEYERLRGQIYDPDDMEDLAEGSPYIWDIPESE